MRLGFGVLSCVLLCAGALPGQEPARSALRVFLDCNAENCSSQEFRTEIRFVDWVNERTAANVHVLVTSQSAGSGTEYAFDFIGLATMDSLRDRFVHRSSNTDTRDETLRGLTQTLRTGLVRYIAHAGLADRIDVRPRGEEEEEEGAGAQTGRDRWNFWVFRAGLDVEMTGEERETDQDFSADFSANRTTAAWKINLDIEASHRRREVELNSGRTFIDRTDEWGADALIVRSIGNHWGTGLQFESGKDVSTNRKWNSRSALAFEWNLFPYEEANRRQFIVHYQVGISRVDYFERTIFDRVDETLGDQLLAVSYDTRQPWGDASISLQFSHYLHDVKKSRASVDGELSFRVFRGLELDVSGSYERIRDQIYLSAEGLDDEEILVERQELATGYQYELSVGLSYRFGSIFNNIVNNRFPNFFF